MICRDCGTQDLLIARRTGIRWYDFPVVAILILIGPIGWIILAYRVWKGERDKDTPKCEHCGRRGLIPFDTPEGQRLASVKAASRPAR